MARPRGLNFYIVIYKEMLKKNCPQELLHQMGQYLAWIIPRTNKVPGVTNGHPLRDIFYIGLYSENL